MEPLKVKASRIRNLTDARYFAARGVEWMGFCLDAARPEAVRPETVREIAEWLDGVKITGEFGAQTRERIESLFADAALHALQLDGEHRAEDWSDWWKGPLIRGVPIDAETTPRTLEARLQEWQETALFFVLDFQLPASRLPALPPALRDALRELGAEFPLCWQIDADARDWKRIADTYRPWGISLLGGEEEKTGYKSFDELDEILDFLETDLLL